ncbi:MAG: hypothetical protein JW757_13415 [Anaerolineales bacterium]|nr:hypothetical protein [Anaerolineales bacterium]
MKKRDLFWLLAVPIYLILGTIRHEAAHALTAWQQGAEITEFVFLPGFRGDQFYFGYVSWIGGETNTLVTAAPYLLDLLTFGVFFLFCHWGKLKRHWLWLNLVIIGIISPLINSGYQYLKPGLGMRGDIGWLLERWPTPWVHGYMISTIALYLTGLLLVFTTSWHIRFSREDQLNQSRLGSYFK